MGKPTGFMEYERKNRIELPVEERIKSFADFHTSLPKDIQRQQAARCMNCGVPFCQSAMKIDGKNVGCPLANWIPEWNHLLYLGLEEEAYRRLEKTAPFPEFTGSVCPALCEAVCCCSIHDEAVGVRSNELYLAELAFAKNWIQPKVIKERNGLKACVIGSGPAGLACAKRLNEAGFSVTVYEKNRRFGGLLMYGIPNMKLDKSIVERRIRLLEEEGIKFIGNIKIGYDISIEEIKEKYDEIVFACGTSLPRGLNLEKDSLEGIYYAVDFLSMTTEDYLLKRNFTYDLKDKRVVIVGGGDTANDCCATAVRMQAKDIIELEITKEPPIKPTKEWPYYPNQKKTDYGVEEANIVLHKDIRKYQTTICRIYGKDKVEGVRIKKVESVIENGKMVFRDIPNTEEDIVCDVILLAMGFLGTKKEDLRRYGMKDDSFIVSTKGHRYADHISVCGDMKNGQSLVVLAIKDGLDCAEEIIEKRVCKKKT